MNPSWEALRGQMGERFYHLATRWLEDSPPGWPEALPQLLEAVPGVQGASLLLHEGEGYSLMAQVGYDDTLLGARESLADSLRWYGGDLEGWQNGKMRCRELPGLAATFEERDTRYMQHGGLAEIQESLIVPLAFEGEVWGFLNLDTFEAAGFPAGLETLCHDLAEQLCLLLASWRQQSAVRRRQTLLEAVADGHGVLRQVHGTQALYDAALSALLEHTRAESGWILRENPLVSLPDHAHPTLYLSLKDHEETFSPEEQVFTRLLAEALGVALEREGALAEAQERTATLRSVAELSALRWGAYRHDIGKIAIPDAVLLKPGSLSEAERAIIRRHPLIGYEMLSGLPELPAGTLQVVRHHPLGWGRLPRRPGRGRDPAASPNLRFGGRLRRADEPPPLGGLEPPQGPGQDP